MLHLLVMLFKRLPWGKLRPGVAVELVADSCDSIPNVCLTVDMRSSVQCRLNPLACSMDQNRHG
jgi:hypothetical protein